MVDVQSNIVIPLAYLTDTNPKHLYYVLLVNVRVPAKKQDASEAVFDGRVSK